MDEMKLIIEKKQYKGDTSVISTRLPIEIIKDLDWLEEPEKKGIKEEEICEKPKEA